MHGALPTNAEIDAEANAAWVQANVIGDGPHIAGIQSAARIALNAAPDKCSAVFVNQLRDGLEFAQRDGIERVQIVDLFQAIAERRGLVDMIGQDGVQKLIARAAERSSHAIADPRESPDSSLADLTNERNERDTADRSGDGQLGEAQAPRFVPVAIDAVQVTAEPAWAIRRILPARGLACIVGPPKCGKSFLASDMLLTVARGAPYAGRETLQGPVIYLTGEGVLGFKRRLVAMRKHFGIEGQGVPFYMVGNVPDLGSETTDLPQLLRDLDAFLGAAGCGAPRVIALDTLARCMGSGDENAAKDMGRFVDRCSAIERHFAALVAVIHHQGKDPNRGARGSNALNGAADVTIMVDKEASGNTATIAEMKDGPEGQEWRFRLAPFDIGGGAEAEACAENITCVVELLSEPQMTEHKPKSARTISPQAQKFLDALLNVLASGAAVKIGNRPAATLAAWKAECVARGLLDPEAKPDSARTLFNTNRRVLIAAERVACERDLTWTL